MILKNQGNMDVKIILITNQKEKGNPQNNIKKTPQQKIPKKKFSKMKSSKPKRTKTEKSINKSQKTIKHFRHEKLA